MTISLLFFSYFLCLEYPYFFIIFPVQIRKYKKGNIWGKNLPVQYWLSCNFGKPVYMWMYQWLTCTPRFSSPPLTAILNYPVWSQFPSIQSPSCFRFLFAFLLNWVFQFLPFSCYGQTYLLKYNERTYSQVSFISRRACVQIAFSSLSWWAELENAAASWSLPSSPLRLRTQPVLSSQPPPLVLLDCHSLSSFAETKALPVEGTLSSKSYYPKSCFQSRIKNKKKKKKEKKIKEMREKESKLLSLPFYLVHSGSQGMVSIT